MGSVGARVPASLTVRTANRYSAVTGAVWLGRTRPAAVSVNEAAPRSDAAPPRKAYQAMNATVTMRSVCTTRGPRLGATILVRGAALPDSVCRSPRVHRGGP